MISLFEKEKEEQAEKKNKTCTYENRLEFVAQEPVDLKAQGDLFSSFSGPPKLDLCALMSQIHNNGK